ncbi:MAG: dimethylarginine dimethylaminohydrolase family protein [Candidatus Methylumidiphilus sp.]
MSDLNEIGVYSEWGKLKEVVVGIVPNRIIIPKVSYSIAKYSKPEVLKLIRKHQGKNAWDIVPKEMESTRQQLEQLCEVYQSHGIKVHRARAWTETEEAFLSSIQSGGFPLFCRDPVLVVGKNVIELSIMTPVRRKEIFAIREVLQSRITEDPSAQYVSMPQALPCPITKTAPEGPGPFLEGGDIFVMGQDILVGHSGLASNTLGIEWLRRYLNPQGYRIHEVPLTGNWLHLDCVLAVIREGLAIAHLPAFPKGLPKLIDDWKIIEASHEEAHGLGCNTLCLEENKVFIGAEHKRIIEALEKEQVELIPVDMNQISKWGGGIRCATHPLRREE